MGPGFEIVTKTRRHSGKVLTLDEVEVRGPGGESFIREVLIHPGAVAVLPVDGDGNVVLIRQLRVAAGSVLLEIPAGLLDVPGEPPEVAAARECEEEVGVRPQRLTFLGRFLMSPGYTDETIGLYLGEDLVPVRRDPASPEERAAEIVTLPFDQTMERVATGEIVDAKTVLALLLAGARGRDG